MKNLLSDSGLKFFLSIISAIVLITSCKNINEKKISGNLIQRDKDPNARMTDWLGAMEYEFNMIKNPTTGKIPEGIREAELAQAREIYAKQQQEQLQFANRLTAVNAYAFQGPNNLGGRTRAIAYDVRNGTTNAVIMAGGVSGGVFKSIDDGTTWVRKSPTGDHFSCTSLAQDTRTSPASARDTWYYATGEAMGNSASLGPFITSTVHGFYLGKGVYKSTDNGETWSHLPGLNSTSLEGFNHRADLISKVVVDPTTGNVYAAALDAIYRSTDGGTTWSVVLTSGAGGFSSGMMSDIVVSSTGRFYAAFSGLSNTGPALDLPGVWTSTTGASLSWTKIAGDGAGSSPAGWNADGTYGRVVLAMAPSLESRVYAIYWNGITSSCGGPTPEAEFYYWSDGTSTWTDISATLPDEVGCLAGNDPFAVQTGYDLVIAVKPDDPATVFIGGTNAYRSTDIGATWTRIGGYSSPADYSLYLSSHPDIHSFAFKPTSTITMLCGNDGGIQRTTDCTAGTVVWTQINTGYRTYQYYHVTLDPRTGNTKVLGGAQDNGSTRNISGTGIDFEMVYGGDGVSVGLNDPAITGGTQYEYVGSQLGFINRRPSTDGLGFTTDITPIGEGGTGIFVTYYKLDADNSQTLYYANDNVLYRTTSASTVSSATWETMSGVATAVVSSHDITAMATTRGPYSASTSSLFIGASDVSGVISSAKLFRLDDPAGVVASTSPVDITSGSFPASAFISSIAVNPRNDDTIIVTFSNYGVTGNVWWTGNANSATPTWTNVEGLLTLPSYRSSAIHTVPGSTEVQYYVGTSVGLYRSGTGFPSTPGWTQEGPSDIGNAVVSSLALRPVDGKLLAGTHGYGMWSTSLSLFPLPVQLTDFSGTIQNNKTALLQWTTSFESNSKHFELEKSIDGISYRRIATIVAAGNSSITKQYSFVDREPLTEKNYYRLRSVDIDNESKISNVVLLKLSGAKQDILVLGNPFKNNILVRFVKETAGNGELRLTDMSGRLMARQSFGAGQQLINFYLPSARLSSGVYLLEAVIGNEKYVSRVLKE